MLFLWNLSSEKPENTRLSKTELTQVQKDRFPLGVRLDSFVKFCDFCDFLIMQGERKAWENTIFCLFLNNKIVYLNKNNIIFVYVTFRRLDFTFIDLK